jgi:hypothetical protein
MRHEILLVNPALDCRLQIDYATGKSIGAPERAHHKVGNVFCMPFPQRRIVSHLAVMVHVVSQRVELSGRFRHVMQRVREILMRCRG